MYQKVIQIVIVKGEIAAMVLAQLGYRACAPTGGEGSDAADYLVSLSLSRNIVIGDIYSDPQVREKMERYAQQRGVLISVVLRFPPEGFKDIDEFLLGKKLQNGGDLLPT